MGAAVSALNNINLFKPNALDKVEGYSGNINLMNRPNVPNKEEGGYSTVRSMSFYADDIGKEVLIPTVSDDEKPRIMSDDEAMEYYYYSHRRKGEEPRYLGIFDTPEEANAMAEKIHKQQERVHSKGGGR